MEASKHDLSKKIGLTYAIQLLKEKTPDAAFRNFERKQKTSIISI